MKADIIMVKNITIMNAYCVLPSYYNYSENIQMYDEKPIFLKNQTFVLYLYYFNEKLWPYLHLFKWFFYKN